MRDPALGGLARHVEIELLIDDLDLVAGERTGIAAGLAEAVVIEQELAPDIRVMIATSHQSTPVRSASARW